MSTEALAVVQGSHTMQIRAEAWLDGELLAADIPVSGGSEERDRSLAVPESVRLTMPRRDRGTSWEPVEPTHPLASFGQLLRIDYGVDIAGHTEWINRGWFLIVDADTGGDTVTVQADGLLTFIDEAKFSAPFQPASGDTLASVARDLVEPALTVVVDSLVDRAVPQGMQWDTDRLGALREVVNAWPADMRVTEDGYLLLEPLVETGDPVLNLTDGVGGTVIRWQGRTSRDGAFNVVVAQGEDGSGSQIQGVAYDRSPSSPFRVSGPFSPLPVPYPYYSPLLTNVAQCRAAAETTLQRLRRSASRMLTVTMVPHPGLLTGDFITVTGAGLTGALAVIETMSLPYSPGEMSLTVRVLDG
ncbi:hypothetical protein [Streptomyces formicae]|uniref:DUF5047 domain-containing protein n=1 Tax=Streptomyces formicae TaxID=1616117 RepID=A0ABY3WT70_9ACTN|nr:hypothetical protein [Streptomyces formicae]UNM13760.1 hypothetical protein J4032_21940 [Streptomyces formicae]